MKILRVLAFFLLLCCISFAVDYVDSFYQLLYLLKADYTQYKEWFPRYYFFVYAVSNSVFPLLVSVLVYFSFRIWCSSTVALSILIVHYAITFLSRVYTQPRYVIYFSFLIVLVATVLVFRYRLLQCAGKAREGSIAGIAYAGRAAKHTVKTLLQIIGLFAKRVIIGIKHLPVALANWIDMHLDLIYFTGLAGLLLGIILWRFYLVTVSNNFTDVDASCRLLGTSYWADYLLPSGNLSRIINPNPDWLPLYFYLSGTVLKLTGSVLWLRFFHVAMSIAGVYFVFNTAKLIASRPVAYLSAVVYLLYPAAVLFSLYTMSEPIFITLLLGAVYYFLNFLFTSNNRFLIYQVLLVNACCLVRYEGWSLPFIFLLVYFVYRLSLNRKMLLATLFGYGGALLVCFMLWYQGYHPLRGILFSDYQVTYSYTYHDSKAWGAILRGLAPAWIPFAFVSALVVLVWFRRKKLLFYSSLVAVLYTVPFVYKITTYTILPQERYIMQYESLLLIPLCFLLFLWFSKITARRWLRVAISGLAIAGLLWVSYYYSFPRISQLPQGYKETVQVATKTAKGSFVLDYHGCDIAYMWMVEANIPFNLSYNDTFLKEYVDFEGMRARNKSAGLKKGVVFLVGDFFHEFKNIDYDHLYRIMQEEKVLYLVLFPNGDLSNYFAFTQEQEQWRGLKFRRLVSKDGYQVYIRVL